MALCAAVTAIGFLAPAAAAAQPSAEASVAPDALMITPLDDGTTASCTAAFVFTDAEAAVYLGYAAHCAGDGVMGLSGCEEPTLPLGSPVIVVGDDGSQRTGRLAYSSWTTMQERGETSDALCFLNDFALVEIAPSDVDPSVPGIGGPTGLDVDGTEEGEPVVSYQPHRSDDAIKDGVSLGDAAGGLTHEVWTDPPGNPGDSGAGYLDAGGEAFGLLSTRIVADGRITNGVTDLAMALGYASRHGGLGEISLVAGTEPFTG
ncbi:MAG: serine protease [Pseudonocardia sp.]|nr:serine protease [Pseudonocardia sp.]